MSESWFSEPTALAAGPSETTIALERPRLAPSAHISKHVLRQIIRSLPYDQTLPLMIRDWRQRWNDVGEARDIHPKNKKDPGERLARWALAKDYGRDLVFSGPLFNASKVTDGTIRVTFDQTGDGLKSRDGQAPKRFEMAGKDRVWHWADAKIEGAEVVVSSANVKAPVAVRYAWASNPFGANLVNSEGLPASVFRSDDWNDVEVEVDHTAAKARAERRALAVEIKALNARVAKLDRESAEFQTLNMKRLELLSKFRSMAPAAGRNK